jgi:hypothetical protein
MLFNINLHSDRLSLFTAGVVDNMDLTNTLNYARE